jgi:hypothetical protein
MDQRAGSFLIRHEIPLATQWSERLFQRSSPAQPCAEVRLVVTGIYHPSTTLVHVVLVNFQTQADPHVRMTVQTPAPYAISQAAESAPAPGPEVTVLIIGAGNSGCKEAHAEERPS